MPTFNRTLEQSVIDDLSRERLFVGRLLPDIENGEVFPAIRPGDTVSFYYSGGLLFSYTASKVFKTNIKYASILDNSGGEPYITENALENLRVKPFYGAYSDIKKVCKLYNQESEAHFVAQLYQSMVKNKVTDEFILLDIEISLSGEAESRIDLAIYNYNSSTPKIHFF